MKKYRAYLLVCVLLCAFLFSGCGHSYELILQDDERSGEAETAASESTAVSYEIEAASSGIEAASSENAVLSEQMIYVYVCGAVKHPGVVQLPGGSRVYEAIEAAGGMTEEADARYINQAQLLEDGQQITVCTAEEAADAGSAKAPEGGAAAGVSGASQNGITDAGKVNLNTADREELMTLNGIGGTKADAILAYREQNGAFRSIEEVMQVSGIGEKSFEKFSDHITV